MRPNGFAQPSRGYTLVEMLVVLLVLGTLSVMTVPLAEMISQRQKEQELRRSLWELRDAIDDFKRARDSGALPATKDASNYPPSLEALTMLYPDGRPDNAGRALRFLRSIPRDPFADPALPASQTWVLRSYLSEASEPKPGGDVYDVKSASNKKALDGSWLRDW